MGNGEESRACLVNRLPAGAPESGHKEHFLTLFDKGAEAWDHPFPHPHPPNCTSWGRETIEPAFQPPPEPWPWPSSLGLD